MFKNRFLTTKVQDKRDVVFEDRRTALLFPGTGQSLVTEEDVQNHKVESHTPGLFLLLGRCRLCIRSNVY